MVHAPYTGRDVVPEFKVVPVREARSSTWPQLPPQTSSAMALAKMLKDILRLLHLAHRMLLDPDNLQCSKISSWFQQAYAIWRRVQRSPALNIMQCGEAVERCKADLIPPYTILLQCTVAVQAEVDTVLMRHRMQQLAGWTAWARKAVEGGASAGHRWSKPATAEAAIPHMPESPHTIEGTRCSPAAPCLLAPRELHKWASIRQAHGHNISV